MLNFTESNMAEAEQRRWYAVDDGVMGGVSQSGFRVDAGAGCFGGEVSLENGGGFASVRREPRNCASCAWRWSHLSAKAQKQRAGRSKRLPRGLHA